MQVGQPGDIFDGNFPAAAHQGAVVGTVAEQPQPPDDFVSAQEDMLRKRNHASPKLGAHIIG
jgi:hypothetical protein